MAEFLSKENLLDELLNLFKDAENFLVLVSPYIKLNDEMKRALQRKVHDEKFVIRIVFGKNEENKSRSLSESDMEFFKKFNNVEIYYNQDLHAKYYANEYASIVTSLNLHQYSVKNNIEIGILLRHRLFNLSEESRLDSEMFDYINFIIEKSDKVLKKGVQQNNYFFGLIKGKKEQVVSVDETKSFYAISDRKSSTITSSLFIQKGYCIRTGKQIPLNIERPFSYEAYQSWSQYSNPDYKEKFCHFSGEKSDGTICFRRPILKKHWKTAMELIVKLEASKK